MTHSAGASADATTVIDGVTFVLDPAPGPDRQVSDADRFILCKTGQQIDFYRSLAKHRPRDIMEIGIYEGGSLVLWDKLFAPRRLVGVDLRPQPVAALEAYRADRAHIRTYYGRGQDRPGTLMAARQNFPTGIDLVIDDASRQYAETKATFEALFPLVRAGGFYVIEQWAWSHRPGVQAAGHPWQERPALTNFLFELTVFAASNPVIHSLHVDAGLVAIRKGPGMLPSGGVSVARYLRGRDLGTI